MKKLCVTIFLLLSFSFSNKLLAAKFSDGYIVKNGDTTYCQIRTPQTIFGLCQSCIQKVIVTKDATGKETQYKSTELDAFGFFYYNEQYSFISRKVAEGELPMFIRVEIVGKKLNLYSYEVMHSSTSGVINYILEDEKKRTVDVTNRKMKEFFKDQPEILELYKKGRLNRSTIQDFVNLVNSKK